MGVIVVVYHVEILVEDWIGDVQGTEHYFVKLGTGHDETHVTFLVFVENLPFLQAN